MNFRQNDIIIVLGAGASVEAGIPSSLQMIKNIEELLISRREWQPYKKLYDYVKSSILYGDGINGKFYSEVNYNIERLVGTLSELEKRKKHIIYPFISRWNMELDELAGANFERISELKLKIITRLKEKWIPLENYERAYYYKNLVKFKEEYEFPLRIFTLNYDLCIEKTCNHIRIERGFDEKRLLDVRKFEDDDERPVDLFLYKNHGSIDWKKNELDVLTYSDEIGNISVDEIEIIFGTNYKLQYLDPYLYSIFEFRKYSLGAKFVIAIGYSFSDEHINGIIRQALVRDSEKKILSVGPGKEESQKRGEIAKKLNLQNTEQVEVVLEGAKDFMEKTLSIEYLKSFFSLQQESTIF